MYHDKIYYAGNEKVWLELYVLDSGLRLGQSLRRPAVVICPGGGYVYLSPREGEPVAAAYAAKGIHAFVLHYSVGWDVKGFRPLQEMDWAIGLIRDHADEWNVAEDKIFTCGFSAGGHLALVSGLMGINRPNGVILGYPAVVFPEGMGMMSRLLTGHDTPTEEEKRWMNLPAQVTDQAPSLFVFTTAQDTLTYGASVELVAAYARCGLPCEFHLFEKGPHGYSLADPASADGSSQVLDPHAAKWLDLSAEWIFSVTGGLQHEDYSTSHIMDAIRELGIEIPQTGDGGNA